jgi:hypothetical protein
MSWLLQVPDPGGPRVVTIQPGEILCVRLPEVGYGGHGYVHLEERADSSHALQLELQADGQRTVLRVRNPGDAELSYHVMLVSKRGARRRETSVAPVRARSESVEVWTEPIDELWIYDLHVSELEDIRDEGRVQRREAYWNLALSSGLFKNDLHALNDDLVAHGYKRASEIQPSWGISGAFGGAGVVVALDLLGPFSRGSSAGQPSVIEVVVDAHVGWRVLDVAGFAIAPLAGIGWAQLDLNDVDPSELPISLHAIPSRKAPDSYFRNIFIGSLALDVTWDTSSRPDLGFFIGLRGGYAFQFDAARWHGSDAKAYAGGPAVDVSGPYALLMLGIAQRH